MVADGVGLGGRDSGPGFHIEVTTDLAKFPAGTPYKAVIFAIGASLKGMGASGLTLDSEEARLRKVIELCKQKKIFVMAVHIGGESKRGAAGSDNERMIDAVAPLADYIVVTKDSNKDGRFTKISQAKKIPLTEIEYALGLVEIVKQVLK
jgi:sugar/nucleoside kinase (ribokinase family)